MTTDPQIASLPLELQKRVKTIVEQYPETAGIIQELIDHFSQEPKHKKVKIQSTADIGQALVTFPDLSFLGPARKRFQLALHKSGLSLSANGVSEFVMNYEDINHILCLATPVKNKAHYTWVIVPKGDEEKVASGTIVFNFDDVISKFKLKTELKLKGKTVNELSISAFEGVVPIPISRPKKDVFVSSGCKDWNGDASYYLNCYDRAKDGYLALNNVDSFSFSNLVYSLDSRSL